MELHEILKSIDRLHDQLSSLRPLPAEALKRIDEAQLIEYTYESNRIEGNTLTLQETALVVNEGITIAGKSMREHLEAINHAEAIGYIREIAQTRTPIDERVIKDVHALILRGLDRVNAGRYRTVGVMISGSRHTPPASYQIPEYMAAFLAEYQHMEQASTHPVIIAAYLHDELVRIHPFIDGNGRTSRLLMNLYLLQHGYPVVSLKADAESKTRYYTTLETSHVEGDRTDFTRFVAESVLETLQRYLNLIES